MLEATTASICIPHPNFRPEWSCIMGNVGTRFCEKGKKNLWTEKEAISLVVLLSDSVIAVPVIETLDLSYVQKVTQWNFSAAVQSHAHREKRWVKEFLDKCVCTRVCARGAFEGNVDSNMVFPVMRAIVVILKRSPSHPWRLTDLNTVHSVRVCICLGSRRQRLPAAKHRVRGSRCSWRR